jgi:hypothetical protein
VKLRFDIWRDSIGYEMPACSALEHLKDAGELRIEAFWIGENVFP